MEIGMETAAISVLRALPRNSSTTAAASSAYDQVLFHRADAGPNRRRVVTHHLQLDASGNVRFTSSSRLSTVDDLDRVRSRLLAHRQNDRALSVVVGDAGQLFFAVFDRGYVADAHVRPRLVLDHDALERVDRRDPSGDAQRDRLRSGVDAAARRSQVLGRQRALNVDRAQVVSAQFDRVHTHVDLSSAAADDRDLADAGDTLDLAAHPLVCDLGHIADWLARAQRDEQHWHGLRIDLAHDRRVDAARQVTQHVADLVAHVRRGHLRRLVQLERDHHLRKALTRRGAKLVDAVDGVDGAFDLVADIGLHLFGCGAFERGRHDHERQIDVRELIEAEPRVADASEHEQHQHQNTGKYRAFDADLSKPLHVSPSR